MLMVFRNSWNNDILQEVTVAEPVNKFLGWHESMLTKRLPSTQ